VFDGVAAFDEGLRPSPGLPQIFRQERVRSLKGRDARFKSTLLLEHEADIHLQLVAEVLHALLECTDGSIQEALDLFSKLLVDVLINDELTNS
jgi:hypothetical protein